MLKIIRKILSKLFSIFPINKRIVTFESFSGKNFTGNCKAILDEMLSRNLDYDYKIFIKKKVSIDNKYQKYIIYKYTLKWLYYTTISKYWIKNTGAYFGLEKRKKQIYINTWHSGGSLKKQGYEMDNTPLDKRKPTSNVRDWDWYVAGSKEKAEEIVNSYGYKGKIYVLGMPRIDYLLNFKKVNIEKIKKQIGIKTKKVILYAPTFRDNDMSGKNNEKVLDGINIPSDCTLLVKFHPHVKLTELKNKKIINVSSYKDINELFIISDCLITDYSTVIFDYSNLKRPIILYAYDFEDYNKKRGFSMDYKKEMPGPIAKNMKELNDIINNVDVYSKKYKKQQELFYERFCSYNDGKAAKRFVNLFIESFFEKEEIKNEKV